MKASELKVGDVIGYWSLHGPETHVVRQIKRRWFNRLPRYFLMGGVGVTIGQRNSLVQDELDEYLKQPRVSVHRDGKQIWPEVKG